MSTGSETEELAVERPRHARLGRWWRGFTGSLAAGLVVLAVIVLGAGLICWPLDAPGPEAAYLIAHPIAAALAMAAQRIADRRQGRLAGIAGVLVVVIAALALSLFWWY
ncbi:hypothetical protein [Amycolatopsis sp.]|uniref:hypothetical protein n=1 Tax=Amycolatopsis sp. TaxID=37632 RepID=UPI002C08B81D|nr:hypothetical protein [Amycolatopsis sp.]HVV10720.1 hypothetical protein [Amycolatopsis sp.]